MKMVGILHEGKSKQNSATQKILDFYLNLTNNFNILYEAA